MVLIILVSPAQTPVDGLLTLVPEVVTPEELITTKRGEVPAENLNSLPKYFNLNWSPTASSNKICGISSPVIPEGNIVTLLAITD
jgi:hypothetical protein